MLQRVLTGNYRISDIALMIGQCDMQHDMSAGNSFSTTFFIKCCELDFSLTLLSSSVIRDERNIYSTFCCYCMHLTVCENRTDSFAHKLSGAVWELGYTVTVGER